MPKIKIYQIDRELEAKPGENILEVLQREGIDINAYCGGFGYCGKCQIKILKGNAAQPTAQEIKHLKEKISQGYRLACQVQIIEDIEIDIQDSITHKVEVLAESGEALLEELPVKKINIQLKKPSLNQSLSLDEIAENQLPTSPFVRNWTIQALQELSRIENQDEKSFELGFDEKQIYWMNSNIKRVPFLGIAFDIGTTTLACELLDLETGSTLYRAGALNRQASFGADVLSRLRAIQDNQGALSNLQELLLSSMNDLIQEACQKTGNDPNRILSLAVAGNTIMEHIFLGVSPISIGTAPFTPVICRSYHISARRLHLVIHPEAQVYI
ncbi:MAG TPA: hypothetical protein DF698_04400, partial [Candidatus Atribacteria bacterium]|nr:hypothetical protein [Candidatus Atribacteria bacterium]